MAIGDQDTFLIICQKTVRECRLAAPSLTPTPTTVLNQIGQLRKIIDWVTEAWVEIQNLGDDWRFMRQEVSFPVIDGQLEYTTAQCNVAAGTFGHWLLDTFRCYKTSVGFPGEIPMAALDYDTWRNWYKFSTMRTAKSQPYYVTQLPNNGLGLGPCPLTGYTVYGDLYTAPVRLKADAEIPTLPIKHSSMVIVYKAMMSYAESEAKMELFGRGQRGFQRLMGILERDQLPRPHLCGALR